MQSFYGLWALHLSFQQNERSAYNYSQETECEIGTKEGPQ